MYLNRAFKMAYDTMKLRRLTRISPIIVALIRILTPFAIGYALVDYASRNVSALTISLTIFAILGVLFISCRAYALHQERKDYYSRANQATATWRQFRGNNN